MKTEFHVFLNARQLTMLHSLRKEVTIPLVDLKAEIHKSLEPIPYSMVKKLDFKPIKNNQMWAKHKYDCAWFHFTGVVPQSGEGKHIALNISFDGEGVGYERGEPKYMVTSVTQSVEVLSPARAKSLIEWSNKGKAGEKIDMYMDAGINWYEPGHFWKARIVEINDLMKDYFYDFVDCIYLLTVTEDKEKRKNISRAIDKSFKALGKRSQSEIQNARDILYPIINGKSTRNSFVAVGHSHLDLAWLWPMRETKRKAVRTFTKQLENIERYKGYIYGASQPQQYEWIKESDPKLYDKIKKEVERGRIEPQGAMWVEPDTNISSGEALIRQIHYGNTFFKNEFNKDMKICWLPDVFGYNGNLPQILSKSDVPYFMTIKLSWNEHNKFPLRTFNWKGIDGSEVLVHMPPAENYNTMCTPFCIYKGIENFPEKNVINDALMLFGVGDGGGGPSEAHLEMLKRNKSLPDLPSMRPGSAIDYFEKLNSKREKLETYNGELYLEKHQGTYTSQGRNKNYNRRMEYELCDLEMLCAYAEMSKRGKTDLDEKVFADFVYPQEKIDELWKNLLLFQFHDILPGSCIERVYVESRAKYEVMLNDIRNMKNEILFKFSNKNGKSLFNPTSFERTEYVDVDGDLYKSVVPAYGISPLTLVDVNEDEEDEFLFSNNAIENKYIKVQFNDKGQIISILDKSNNVETLKGLGNELRIYRDKRLFYNAWDIDWKYYEKPFEVLSGEVIDANKTADRIYLKYKFKHGKSTIIQEVSLGKESKTVDFDTFVDWNEKHKMLRVEFEPIAYSDEVKCDIQMGAIKRTTKNESNIEKAQFEVCAHKYVEVDNGEYSFALLNDCKYGHRVKEGRISLNLLRAPKYPDPNCDICEHHFKYSVYPHKSSESETVKLSYFINKPCIELDGNVDVESFVSSDNENVIIETVKVSNDNDGLIIRAYNYSENESICSINTKYKYSNCTETNLQEKKIGQCELTNIAFNPYEIKTFKLV